LPTRAACAARASAAARMNSAAAADRAHLGATAVSACNGSGGLPWPRWNAPGAISSSATFSSIGDIADRDWCSRGGACMSARLERLLPPPGAEGPVLAACRPPLPRQGAARLARAAAAEPHACRAVVLQACRRARAYIFPLNRSSMAASLAATAKGAPLVGSPAPPAGSLAPRAGPPAALCADTAAAGCEAVAAAFASATASAAPASSSGRTFAITASAEATAADRSVVCTRARRSSLRAASSPGEAAGPRAEAGP